MSLNPHTSTYPQTSNYIIQRNDTNYNYIVSQINTKGDLSLLIKLLMGLSHCVNKLVEAPETHHQLLRAVWALEVRD